MNLLEHFQRVRRETQPTPRQNAVMLREFRLLRERLEHDASLRHIVLFSFVQGSYRRKTAIRGSAAHPCDVDVVAVTNVSRRKADPSRVQELFLPFLERHYKRLYKRRMRSWCITVDSEVTLDLVPTAESESPQLDRAMRDKSIRDWLPSDEDEEILRGITCWPEWDPAGSIWIPSGDRGGWEKTHPFLVTDWTQSKNARCNGLFCSVVRAMKWWRRHVEGRLVSPRGYALEHLTAECCPDGITSLPEGIALSFNRMAERFRSDAARLSTPHLEARGVFGVDVLRRVEGHEFAAFHASVCRAAAYSRQALTANDERESKRLWSFVLGGIIE